MAIITLKNLRYLYLVVLGCCLCGCQRSTLRELSRIESYVENSPDSALASLAKIDSSCFSGEHSHALYNYLVALGRYKAYIDDNDITGISRSIDFFRKHHDVSHLLKALYLKGYTLYRAQNYNLAIVTLSEAESLAEDNNDLFWAGVSSREMAKSFEAMYSEEDFLNYIQKAYGFFREGRFDKHADYALLQMGNAFSQCGNYQKAQDTYIQAITIARENRDTAYLCKALWPYAENLVLEGKAEKAISVFRQLTDTLHYRLSCSSYACYGRALAMTGSRESSSRCFAIADALSLSEQDKYIVNYHRYYAFLALSDFEQASETMQRVFAFASDNNNRQRRGMALRAQRDFFHEQERLASLEKQLSEQKTYTVTAISVIILIIFIIILLCVFRMVKSRRTQHLAEKQELVRHIQDISNQHADNLKKTTKAGMHYFNTLTQIYWQNQPHKVLPGLENILQGLVSDEQVINRLISTLNETHNNLMLRLSEQVSALNSKEILLYCYLANGLEHNTICTIVNKAPTALNAQIYRLRKKIEASSAPDKEEFISTIA